MNKLVVPFLSLFLLIGFTAGAAETVKPDHIDLVLVLDKSGSMHGLEADTIGGFNSMLKKQSDLGVPTDVTTVLFNHQMVTLHARKPIADVAALEDKDYRAGGNTALLDAVGSTIGTVATFDTSDYAHNKVIFVIITDGMENSSREFSKQKVHQLISDCQDKRGWEFIFLGANIDAAEEAGQLGISADRAMKYENSARGVQANFKAVATFAEGVAAPESVDASAWREEVVEDKSE